MLTLVPGQTNLNQLHELWKTKGPAKMAESAYPAIDAAANLVQEVASRDEAIYGVNTGFGKLASVRIHPEDTERLQRNLILSHCCGVGEPVDASAVRLMMVLKLLSAGRGASGIRLTTLQLLEDMLREQVTPVIPAQGSVGASGDLAPLAHMTATMIGEGEAYYRAERMPPSKL